MKLVFPLHQAEYDAWIAHWNAKAEDPDDDTHPVDVMDMNFVLAAGLSMAATYPEHEATIHQWLPEAVERAGSELGMFRGCEWIGAKIGLSPEASRAFGHALLHPPKESSERSG